MKIVFFGTPAYVLPILDAVYKNFKNKNAHSAVVAVVTQKPKLAGRKKIMTYSAVDAWAFSKRIPKYFSPSEILENKIEADLGIVASFGEIIPLPVIKHFPYGLINIHPSILPKYRGASPIQAAIAFGEKETGISIIKLDEKMDHGPILTQTKEDILENETNEKLRDRLFEKSAQIVVEMIEPYLDGKINLKPQDDAKATYTKIIIKDDGFIPLPIIKNAIDGKTPSEEIELRFVGEKIFPDANFIERLTRALTPWPLVWTKLNIDGKEMRLIIHDAEIKNGKLEPQNVQLEGKNKVSWKQFLEAYQI